MKTSDMLITIANWLESPNNEAILLSEQDDDCLNIVANSCVEAATALRKAAEQVEIIEPTEESNITPESLDGLAEIATAFDQSNDPMLKKQASLIDELLLTIAASPKILSDKKAAEDQRILDLRNKYQQSKEWQDKDNKVSEAVNAIEKSPMMKEYRPMEAPLSTRYCPDHHGTPIMRVSDHVWKCELDKKEYDFNTGFTKLNGEKVPGSNVENQTKVYQGEAISVFDNRESRLGGYRS